MRWLATLSLVLGFITFFLILGNILAVKYYRMASQTHPPELRTLERELEDLRANLQKASLHSPQTIPAQAPPPSVSTPPRVSKATAPGGEIPTHFFPPQTQFSQAKQSALPIRVQPPQMSWTPQGLWVEFALEYIKNDRGTHQGKILILAHGKNTLLSYPEETLKFPPQNTEQTSLLHPEKGESFSLSRYRKVSALFSSLANKQTLHSVEVFLFNPEGSEVLFHETYSIPNARSSHNTHSEEPQA